MPYRYLEDVATADAAFEAEGSSLEELFKDAHLPHVRGQKNGENLDCQGGSGYINYIINAYDKMYYLAFQSCWRFSHILPGSFPWLLLSYLPVQTPIVSLLLELHDIHRTYSLSYYSILLSRLCGLNPHQSRYR